MGALDRVFRGRRGGQDRPLAAQVAALFANGEQGLWYDVEGFRDAWNSVGPELLTNGDFSAGSAGWAAGAGVTISTGSASFSSTSAGVGITQAASAPYVSGDWYEVTLTISNYVSGSLSARLGGSGAFTVLPAGNGTKSVLVLATGSTTSAAFLSTASGVTLDVVLVSVKRWLGLPSCALFQDATGTLPAYMPGQGQVDSPVGLLLDKRLRLQPGAALSAPDFTLSAWPKSAAATATGPLAFSTTGAGGVFKFVNNFFSVGRYYDISVTFEKADSSTSFSLVNVDSATAATPVIVSSTAASGTLTARWFALSGGIYFRLGAASAVTITAITVREVQGNHAYQASTPSRPTLSARYNSCIATEDPTQPNWVKTGATPTKNYAVAPDGTTTGALLTFDALGYITCIESSVAPGITKTLTVHIKDSSSGWARVSLASTAAGANGAGVWVNTSTGAVGNTLVSGTGYSLVSASTSFVAGWLRVAVTVTGPAEGMKMVLISAPANGSSSVAAGSSLLVWGVDIRSANDGVGLPPYQRVVDANNYDTVGFPLYLASDGVDDWMVTSSLYFSGTSRVIVVATARKLNDNLANTLLEFSPAVNSNPGTFALFGPISAASPGWALRYAGATPFQDINVLSAGPVSALMSARIALDGAGASLSANGVTGSNASVSGGGSLGNYALYLFKRAGSTLPFKGRLYGLLIRAGAASDGQIQKVERLFNQKGRVF